MRTSERRARLGVAVASRTLTEFGVEGSSVKVSIGVPRKSGNRWECRFVVDGLGRSKVVSAGGVDSLQALLGAIQGVRTILDQTGRSFVWIDRKWGTAIPYFIPVVLGQRVEDRLKAAIEREEKRYVLGNFRSRKARFLRSQKQLYKNPRIPARTQKQMKQERDFLAQWEKALREWKPQRRHKA
jgi:hypothetical protein